MHLLKNQPFFEPLLVSSQFVDEFRNYLKTIIYYYLLSKLTTIMAFLFSLNVNPRISTIFYLA